MHDTYHELEVCSSTNGELALQQFNFQAQYHSSPAPSPVSQFTCPQPSVTVLLASTQRHSSPAPSPASQFTCPKPGSQFTCP